MPTLPRDNPPATIDVELERLELQQRVWERHCRSWIGQLKLRAGDRVLDAGCGPGVALHLLRERVGAAGVVYALDESPRWLARVRARAVQNDWGNVVTIDGRAQGIEPSAQVDAVFARWLLSLSSDPCGVVEHLARWLVPGGRMLVIDYNHEGLSLFPRSPGFDAVIRATREMYASRGCDPWVAGRLPELFRRAGLTTRFLDPAVLCGPPGSDAWRWGEFFFVQQAGRMHAAGHLTRRDYELFLAEGAERRGDPDAVFFSPMVVAGMAVRPE